jgi:hypothetical protein
LSAQKKAKQVPEGFRSTDFGPKGWVPVRSWGNSVEAVGRPPSALASPCGAVTSTTAAFGHCIPDFGDEHVVEHRQGNPDFDFRFGRRGGKGAKHDGRHGDRRDKGPGERLIRQRQIDYLLTQDLDQMVLQLGEVVLEVKAAGGLTNLTRLLPIHVFTPFHFQ